MKQVRPYINKRRYKFDVAVDPRLKVADQFGVKALPTQFLIGSDGSIISENAGFTDGDEEKYLEELLNYFHKENIEYDESFQFVKQIREKTNKTINVNF